MQITELTSNFIYIHNIAHKIGAHFFFTPMMQHLSPHDARKDFLSAIVHYI